MNKFMSKFLGGKNKKEESKKFCQIQFLEMGIALLFILFGIIVLATKAVAEQFIAIFLGIVILLDAALNIYSFITKKTNRIFMLNIVFGVLYIIMAVLLFSNIFHFLNYIAIYFGIYLALCGIKQCITGIVLKMAQEESFLIILIMGILILALGILVIFYPFESFGIIETISIFALLLGLLNIATANLLKNRADAFISKVDND